LCSINVLNIIVLFSIHWASHSHQHGEYEKPDVVSPQENKHEVYDLAEDGDSAPNLYSEIQKPQVQQSLLSDQCHVYDKLATSSVEDPADCYSKLDRDKHIENTADVYAVVDKKKFELKH